MYFNLLEEVGEKWGEPNADRALQPPLYEDNIPPTRPEDEGTTIMLPKKNLDKTEGKPGNLKKNVCYILNMLNKLLKK